MRIGQFDFNEIVVADFEYQAEPGGIPRPVCLVAKELCSGHTHRLFGEELHRRTCAPFPTSRDCLFVAYYASAEIGCFLSLGWRLPEAVLDLFVEHSVERNGLVLPSEKRDLLGALLFYGLDCIQAAEKKSMRQLALRGGPYTPEKSRALLEYCESDVLALERLLPRMSANLDIPRALQRGRYMVAAARIENVGVPIDLPGLTSLRGNWANIQVSLIDRVDRHYGVYEGLTFKTERWARFLALHDIPWPRLESGELALDDETFRDMARGYPQIQLIRELRCSLSQLRLEELAVGPDARNRVMLSAFRAKTGRNQPSNTRFIFGPATWLRGLIKPGPATAIAYIDWSQQEFGIAAALSGDPRMITAYETGDPYLAFAKQAGAVPPEGTKQSHSAVRDQFKACVLGVQYGMGPDSLARRISQPPIVARDLLRMHRETYPVFWRWSEAAVDHAMLRGYLHTVFGWKIRTGPITNPRSLRNFPMQANGAEMLRFACCFATERGIRVCAPVHDAILVEGPSAEIDDIVAAAQTAMGDASELVLDGFRLRADVKIIRSPERYQDERGKQMWDLVWSVIGDERSPEGAD